MNKALVSIIVPVFNVENYMKKCLDSVINQTYKNIEILLIDDGSKDSSGKICDEYSKKDKRIKIFHKENGGLSSARNYGIEKATGEYLTFIDSDDTLEVDYIEYLYNLITKYDTDLSICPYTVIINETKKYDFGKKYKEEVLNTEQALTRMLCEEGFTVSACAKLYKKELFDDIRYPLNKLCEDNGTTYKTIMKCNKIAYGNESKYNYFKRPNSIMTSKFNIKRMDLIELTDIMCNDIEKKYPSIINACDKRRIHSRFSILRQMINCDLNKEEKEKQKEIIKYLKKNKRKVFKNKEFNKRDKAAILSLMLGKHAFKISWNIYDKIRN